jgi:hypothetical protein
LLLEAARTVGALVTRAFIIIDGQDILIPLGEATLPTHRCRRCGIVAAPRL